MSIADLNKSATTRMQKSADTLKDALSKLRTGRANTAMLDHLRVEYYGNMVPLNRWRTWRSATAAPSPSRPGRSP